MNQSFFIGAIGAHQQQKHLNLHGNNIANVNTYGFKAEKGQFAALMYDDIKAIDSVHHDKLQKAVREIGIPDHLTCLLRNL